MKKTSEERDFEGISVETPEIDIKPYSKAPIDVKMEQFKLNIIQPSKKPDE